MTIEEKIVKYLELSRQAKQLSDEADNLKQEINLEMPEDKKVFENLAVFSRSEFDVERFDKTKAEQKMSPEDFRECSKVTKQKRVELISWDSYNKKSKFLRAENERSR